MPPSNNINVSAAAKPPVLSTRPKPFKVYTVRVYVIDGAYNGEMIDEFQYKADHYKSFAGQFIRRAESEVQALIENIGKNGHTITTPSGGKVILSSSSHLLCRSGRN